MCFLLSRLQEPACLPQIRWIFCCVDQSTKQHLVRHPSGTILWIVGTQMCEEIKKLPCDFFRLTAYVAKVFAMANSLVAVPDNMICDAVKYLILFTQQPDGRFKELGNMIHGEMIVRFPPHFICIAKKD